MGAMILSNCCNFSVVMVGDGDQKNFHYECNNCLERCETHMKAV